MKGRTLKMFPPSDYRAPTSFARAVAAKSCGGVMFSLILSVSLLIWQSLSAGQPTITLSQDAEKALSEFASDETILVVKPSSTNKAAITCQLSPSFSQSSQMTSPCTIVDCLATFTTAGGAGGLVVLAGFKPVAGRREAAWVGSIPTRLRQESGK